MLNGLLGKASSDEDFTFECALFALRYFKHSDIEFDPSQHYFEGKTLPGGRSLRNIQFSFKLKTLWYCRG